MNNNEKEFTDNGMWTPQTFMLMAISEWVSEAPYDVRSALSIDNSPTLDPILLKRWPGINIRRAVYPEHDAQDLSAMDSSQFDLVYSHQVLEHIPKPWKAASEMVRLLKKGGIGLHTTCAFNPRHGLPEFNDYYRFLPDGLAELFEGVDILEKRGWGNRDALLYNVAVNDGFGDLGGRRFNRVIGSRNDERYPWVTWIVFSKL